jgi:hypothetical protein
MSKIIPIKTHSTTHTRTDTILVSSAVISSWKSPPFQRPLRINAKVLALAEKIKADGGVIPGVVTLGMLGRDTYLLDGQHRAHAFLLSEMAEGFADVRVHQFTDMGDMGEEFVNLNSRLVNFRPDDILRGLEEALPTLRSIRQKCPYVGYDMIRRGTNSPIMSMSTLLRCWYGSAAETPVASSASALLLAKQMTTDDADMLVKVLGFVEKAWGRDLEYARLWSALNLTLCFWLYRRLVVAPYSAKTEKMSNDLYIKCLMSVSADSKYIDWLLGRHMSERDRSPAFSKIKIAFVKRIQSETGKKPMLPSPAWSKSHEKTRS